MPKAEDTQRGSKPVPDQVTIRGDAAALSRVAEALAGRRLQRDVRAFVIPDDAAAYSEAIDGGAIAALHGAGFVICAPGTDDPALAQGEMGLRVPDSSLADTMDAVLGPAP
jgi:homoaconitase/3-isopropylmalate dehydratase large subunit